MKRQYLHLSAYSCDKCTGPVVAGSLAVRENEISKETDIRQVGAICLSCGHRQSKGTEAGVTRNFPPVQWESMNAIDHVPLPIPGFSCSGKQLGLVGAGFLEN
jgi:hypothetical protein